MPFPIRALQVDGGSEFAAEFEVACPRRGLRLFVLPPRSPKLNGAVERANRTHTEEFYQVTVCSLEMKKLNRELRQWEKIYNTVRPHQSLGYLTPQPVPAAGLISKKEMKSVTHLLDEYMSLTIPGMWAKMMEHFPRSDSSGFGLSASIVGLWRSWERASMAWKRSSVRSRPGPPILSAT